MTVLGIRSLIILRGEDERLRGITYSPSATLEPEEVGASLLLTTFLTENERTEVTMYDRSERFKKLKTRTPAKVGPATYLIPYIIQYDQKQSYVPFLFSDYVGKGMEVPKRLADEPGPANYFPQTPIKHIPGGNTLSNTATRFRYEPDEPEVPPTKVRKPYKIPGKICKGRMTLSSVPTGVSIPQDSGYYGYTKKQDGTWVKVKPPEIDTTLGPAFYDIDTGETNFTTLIYKGFDFGNRSARTTGPRPKEGPGPADYDIRDKKPSLAEQQNEAIRSWKRSTCKVLRYTEQIYRTNLRENIPGPNHYSYPLVKPRQPKGKVRGAFWSSQRRFPKERKEKRPGPADYLGQRSLPVTKPGSLLDAPFLYMVPRFPQRMPAPTPGPASYDVPSGLVCKRPSKWATACAAFDSSAPRKFTFLERGTKTPAPNEYFVKHPSCEDDHRHAVFKSLCERFEEPRIGTRPEALDYRAIEVEDRLLRPTSHRLAHGDRQAPFLQTTRRFGRIVNAPKQNVAMDGPAPGAYTPCDLECAVTRGSMSTSPRFKKRTDLDQPGPGEYTINPVVAESCVKGTFNVTLDNPLSKYEDKKHVTWDVRVRGRKFLKWFAQGGSQYYKHC